MWSGTQLVSLTAYSREGDEVEHPVHSGITRVVGNNKDARSITVF